MYSFIIVVKIIPTCVPCRKTHQDWETNGEQVLRHILPLCPSCASQSAVFCGLLPKHLSSLANIYHHSMFHGGVPLSKIFCNVPSSNLNGEGPHATTFVCFVHLLCTAYRNNIGIPLVRCPVE